MTRFTSTMQRRADARFSASSRPVPHDLRRRISPQTRMTTLPSALAVRLMGTTLVLGFMALVALVVVAPVTVTIPMATVLVLGFVIGGVFALIDRHRSRPRIMGGVGHYSAPRGLGRLR